MKIEVLSHATIRLEGDSVIYFDPYDIKDYRRDADYIFITHDHYDHYDANAIEKIKKPNTRIIVPVCLKDRRHTLLVEPGKDYQIDELSFKTIPAYNVNKNFHLKEMGYVGYQLLLEDGSYYIMGDTDRTPEAENVKTDYCFVPIGGTYTMDVEEAISYINDVEPKIAIPIHYGKIVGDLSMGQRFKEGVKPEVKVLLKIEEEVL